uniref:RecA-superfamily ATPase, KaiC/GvpD/RAD55 family n=1 Tax=Candidatus Kentrum sp. MB TaxID=2138164 RepID=A0A450XXA8_9GAMM|nr:MAG: RecA-superfamily ATPase, KaiC/GvpD/RAD55 family [Candidatus Kentron sp. MB]VFK33895.1 MAG: RecA-superfamily ATPase, KaiC/GvpD/RAD55 family [Candidatus Kentron sp. MB]VFK76499.1 MAG: RecA-superfamily ATPase, KaiC/GvpD/RAD55 family [Candidatus Kentron sp. MB]
MSIDIETSVGSRVGLGHVVDMLRVINAAALTTEAEHNEEATRGGMPVARLWETAHKMKEKGHLGETEDCLSLEPKLFHETLRLLVNKGYYHAYIGVAKGPLQDRKPYFSDDGYVSQANDGATWHIVSRSKRSMAPSCFPMQRPNEAVMAIFKGIRSDNLIQAAVHEHIRTTFHLSQSEEVFRTFRVLAHTYNRLREENHKDISSSFSRTSLSDLLKTLGADLQKDNAIDSRRAEQLARAFVEFAICADIVWRDPELCDHLTLATPCKYQWLLSTLFGLQTSMGELDRVFLGGILLPGSARIRKDRHGHENKQKLVGSLAAVVQGESGSGKTTFACHLGFDIVRHGGVCLYLALEQWPSDLQRFFHGFGWLPESDTFDYLGPSSVISQQMDKDDDLEKLYFREFRKRVEQNHLERKGIFGLMPIRPTSWDQLREWIDSFLEINALRSYPISILMLDPFNAFVALADPPSLKPGNGPSSEDQIAPTKLGSLVRAATGEIFELAKYHNVNILMVCEGEHMKDKEISHITNSSDLVFALHRSDSGAQEPGVTEAGFHAWSRHLSIRKSRFQKTLPGHHRFKITENGVSIDLAPQAFVRWLEGNIPPRRLDLPLSSGFPDLDYVLQGESKREGELCRDSFTVYMGPTGCAKSELATLFLLAPAAETQILDKIKEKEPGSRRSLLVTFRDDWASVESVLRGPIGDYLGMKDLEQARQTLTLLQLQVGFVSASDVLAALQKVFEKYAYRGEIFRRVVFDNLAYMELMSPLLKSDPYFIHSLMTLLRQKRASVLFVTSSMDAVENSTLQARIRDSADNVVVFDRPKSREGEINAGTTHMTVLKSVHMEHHQERYVLSFGKRLPSLYQTRQFQTELSTVLKGENGCSEKAEEVISKISQLYFRRFGCLSVSFVPLIRELLRGEDSSEGNKPKEENLVRRIMDIHRMQGFLRLETPPPFI